MKKELIVFIFTVLLSTVFTFSCNKQKNETAEVPITSGGHITRISGEYFEDYPFENLSIEDARGNIVHLRVFGTDEEKISDFISAANLSLETYTTELELEADYADSSLTDEDSITQSKTDVIVYVDSAVFHTDVQRFEIIASEEGSKKKTRGGGDATYTGAPWWHQGMICYHGGTTVVSFKWERKYCGFCSWATSNTGFLSTWGCNHYSYGGKRIRIIVTAEAFNYGIHFAKWEGGTWVRYWPD